MIAPGALLGAGRLRAWRLGAAGAAALLRQGHQAARRALRRQPRAPRWPAPLLLPIWSELEKVPGVVLVSGSGRPTATATTRWSPTASIF
jgi:hypothetical protein